MFVTELNFDTPPLNLPGLDKMTNSFSSFVTAAEDEQLSILFGYKFWKAFKAGLALLPADWITPFAYVVGNLVVYSGAIYIALQNSNNITPTSDPTKWGIQPVNRWLVLKVGSNYSYLGVDYNWVGMTEMVKPMIYSLWARYVIDNKLTQVGNVKGKSENSEVVSPNVRICRSWNQYDKLAAGNRRFSSTGASIDNNVYGYLYANAATFDDVVQPSYTNMLAYLADVFKTPGQMNIFDL